MIFDSIPIVVSELVNTLFPDSAPSVVVLPLSAITREIQDSLNNWLHERELNQLAQFSYEKRHREWLGGRICAKQSLRIFLQQQDDTPFTPEHQQSRIASEESGRPYFTQLAEFAFSFPELSISHSKDFAAAMSSTTHCGIDIQYPAENLLKVKERFATTAEEFLLQESLPQLPILEQLSLLWAGKEAVKKMLSPYGMPGFHELTLHTIRHHDASHAVLYFSQANEPEKLLPVATTILASNYALALCCSLEQARATNNQTQKDARTP